MNIKSLVRRGGSQSRRSGEIATNKTFDVGVFWTVEQISEIMTHHHRTCDDYFSEMENLVSAGDWEQIAIAGERFRNSMLNHFQSEEDTLFPAFEEVTGSSQGPTTVMRMEHKQMRSLLDGLEESINNQHADQLLGVAGTLMLLIQQHNMKEEQILYPMLDQALQQPEALVERLNLTANA